MNRTRHQWHGVDSLSDARPKLINPVDVPIVKKTINIDKKISPGLDDFSHHINVQQQSKFRMQDEKDKLGRLIDELTSHGRSRELQMERQIRSDSKDKLQSWLRQVDDWAKTFGIVGLSTPQCVQSRLNRSSRIAWERIGKYLNSEEAKARFTPEERNDLLALCEPNRQLRGKSNDAEFLAAAISVLNKMLELQPELAHASLSPQSSLCR